MADANRLPPDVRRFFCVLAYPPMDGAERRAAGLAQWPFEPQRAPVCTAAESCTPPGALPARDCHLPDQSSL